MKFPHLATAIFCLVLVEVRGQRQMSHCGQLQRNPIPLITHSKPTQHRWPWHAAIFHLEKEQEINYKCGGTAISSNRILTAAHCVTVYNTPMEQHQISVSLGRFDLSNVNETSAQWPTVAEIIPHPNYDSSYYSNDIAIIWLSTDIKFNEFVQPICLWGARKTDFSEIDGRVGIVVGWGHTESGEVSKELRQTSLPVISHLECLVTHRDFFGQYLSPTKFCAGFRNGTSVCVGDSGGSMVFENSQIYYIRGIVSVSVAKINFTTHTATCDPMEYALFTDVARYLSWIGGGESPCVENARCEWDYYGRYRLNCRIELPNAQQQCKMVFEEQFSSATEINILGQLDSFPDISDAGTKFMLLEGLVLSNLKLKIVDRAALTTFSKIKVLKLNNNEISELAADTFDDLTDLTNLYLDRNFLKELHADTFKGLPNIEGLSLDGNQFETLPANIFQNNQELETLLLNDNKLKELHEDTFKGLPNLQLLVLSNNRFETLPANIFQNNQELDTLMLKDNKLKELHSDTFKGLPNLGTLLLNNNRLETLPANIFRNNKKLRTIFLQDNKFKELHADTFKGLPIRIENVCSESCRVIE